MADLVSEGVVERGTLAELEVRDGAGLVLPAEVEGHPDEIVVELDGALEKAAEEIYMGPGMVATFFETSVNEHPLRTIAR